jgi:Arc/MetJ family transcription regulator
MHEKAIFICMRTTVILDDVLVAEARRLTGIERKTDLLHAGLRALIASASARRLAALGKTEPDLRMAPRRRGEPAG